MSTNNEYLLVIVDDVNTVPVVDIDGPPVFILQGGSHQQVGEAVVIEVWSSRQCITKPGILGLFLRLESSIRYKHFLLDEGTQVYFYVFAKQFIQRVINATAALPH